MTSVTPLELLRRLGLDRHERVSLEPRDGPEWIATESPSTGRPIAWVRLDTPESYELAAHDCRAGFEAWRRVPAPARGEIIRVIGNEFRRLKSDLGALVSLEAGKIRAEGDGEIQEIIDICDFAVGLSRQLPGQVFPSERPGHRLMEQWLPLGPVGVISAFNFPAAVWAWNAAIAGVCGDSVLWKPSLLSPLTALACNGIAQRVATDAGHPNVFRLVIGTDTDVGERLIADRRFPLISATGSCRMGRRVGQVVAARLGRSLLELGGNNACIVHADADLDLALRAVLFGAVGTAGQRCTTTRRLILHRDVADRFLERLTLAYAQVQERLGDPLAPGTLIGPLITATAADRFDAAVRLAVAQGGQVLCGGGRPRMTGDLAGGHFVQPTLIRAPSSNVLPIAREETFAPILYTFTYTDFDEAIALQNSVDQGLSSAVFTESLRVADRFIAPDGTGSDCGIANINCGTSGAEIGGAFGGEKDTGGGRESGSDSWKAYMRRQTTAVNFAGVFALAQGIRFE
jgi:aldehyde dehydrogenase (NAD+)